MNRIHRNFWLLVTAAVVAAALVSTAASMPAGPVAGIATGVAGLAAVTSLALAGRIYVVVSRRTTGQTRRGDRSRPPS